MARLATRSPLELLHPLDTTEQPPSYLTLMHRLDELLVLREDDPSDSTTITAPCGFVSANQLVGRRIRAWRHAGEQTRNGRGLPDIQVNYQPNAAGDQPILQFSSGPGAGPETIGVWLEWMIEDVKAIVQRGNT